MSSIQGLFDHIVSTFLPYMEEIRAYLVKTYGNRFENGLIEQLVKFGKVQSFKQKEIIIDVGMSMAFTPLLVKGSIRILRPNEEGQDVMLYYLTDGDTCPLSLTAGVRKGKSQVRAIAESDCTLIFVPAQLSKDLIAQYRSWTEFLLQSYDERLNEMILAIDSLAFKSLDERVLNYLHEKSRLANSKWINITHYEIAEDLNSSRVVISRILKELENRENIRLQRGKIFLM